MCPGSLKVCRPPYEEGDGGSNPPRGPNIEGRMSNNYNFPPTSFRARCLKVVDGDTVDLYVDMGFHSYRKERFRLLDIDTPELRDRDPEERAAAKAAKEEMIDLLKPGETDTEWPLRITTLPDPDSFGRYLARIYMWFDEEACEICINDFLVELGHAEYRHY